MTEIKYDSLDWWEEEEPEERAACLFRLIEKIGEEQSDRMEKNLRCAMLYGNMPITSLTPDGYSRTNVPSLPENRTKMNIISSMCDTTSAKISKMKPPINFITMRGDWAVQDRAKRLKLFVDGLFYRNKVYSLHQKMFKDGTVLDIGAVKHYREGNRICSEAALGCELFVDSADAMYGTPRTLYQIRFINRKRMLKKFPKSAKEILAARSTFKSSEYQSQTRLDYILVVEAWHLPSTPEAGDGVHTISVDTGELFTGPWKRSYFPFTFFRWTDSIVGFYGQALADRLTGNQIQINKMLRVIDRSFHLGSQFKIFLEYGSRVPKEHLNNDIGSIIYYAGQPPTFATPQVVHPQFFDHLRWLISSSYEEAGVSALSAALRVPKGIDGGSGRAISEYNDLETERFVIQAQRYEATFLDTAGQYVDLAREIAADGGDLEVEAESKRFLDTIKWSEVALENNEFVIQMLPTAALPATFAGKIRRVEQLLDMGLASKQYARGLLELPDVEENQSLEDAEMEDIKKTAYEMLYEGKTFAPEPIQALPLAVTYMRSYYLRARLDGAPQNRLDLILDWISRADLMVNQAKNAASMAAPAQPAAAQTPAPEAPGQTPPGQQPPSASLPAAEPQ